MVTVGRRVVAAGVMVAACLGWLSPAEASYPGTNGRVVFRRATDTSQNLMTMNPDGSDVKSLTEPSAFIDNNPAWSPDGSYVAFDRSPRSQPEEIDIYVVRRDGSHLRRLTTTPGYDTAPEWSPDGKQLVFASVSDPQNDDVFVMDADGLNRRRVTSDAADEFDSAWSPRGDRLAFTALSGPFSAQVQRIHTVRPDGTDRVDISGSSNRDLGPDWSPDAGRIAFQRGLDVYLVNPDGSDARPLAATTAVEMAPAWSPDGTKVAYEYRTGGISGAIFTVNADGTSPRRISPLEGQNDGAPDWQPLVEHVVTRRAGPDRIGTSVAISQSQFAVAAASTVVLARSDGFADALAAAPLAAMKRGPLLLTASHELSEATRAEMRRVLPAGMTVHLAGGPVAVAESVAEEVRMMGYQVKRLAGDNRYATAVAITEDGLGAPAAVIIATGQDFPDALSAGAAAGFSRRGVLLTDGPRMPQEVSDYFGRHPGTQRTAVGGPAAAADGGAERIVGANRYDTSARVAEAFFRLPSKVAVSSGENFPDALSGGPAAAASGAPLLLTASQSLSPETANYIAAGSAWIAAGEIYGGPSAVSDLVATQVKNTLG